jgi:hypothetical protein
LRQGAPAKFRLATGDELTRRYAAHLSLWACSPKIAAQMHAFNAFVWTSDMTRVSELDADGLVQALELLADTDEPFWVEVEVDNRWTRVGDLGVLASFCQGG